LHAGSWAGASHIKFDEVVDLQPDGRAVGHEFEGPDSKSARMRKWSANAS